MNKANPAAWCADTTIDMSVEPRFECRRCRWTVVDRELVVVQAWMYDHIRKCWDKPKEGVS